MQGFNSLCIIRAVRNPKKTRKMDKSRFYAMGLLALTSLSFKPFQKRDEDDNDKANAKTFSCILCNYI